jgi:hypothetical protein
LRLTEKEEIIPASTREAACHTGIAAAEFSRIRNADFGRFTLDRLIRIRYSLNHELEVEVTIQSHQEGK